MLPLYFRAIGTASPYEIVAHRICWSVLLLIVILYFRRRLAGLAEALTSGKYLVPLMASAVLIAINWLVYIWAVQHQHVVAASLGYFLNPLLNVVLGFALLRERLSKMQWGAVACAGAGVAVLAAGALSTLWVSLALAGSFGFYGLIRKVTPVGPMVGLAAETIILSPVAGAYLAWLAATGAMMFAHGDMRLDILLMASGAVTAVPLLLFATAAQRLTLATLGLIQYLGPTIQLILSLTLFGEQLTMAHIIAFPLIWAGLAIYSASAWHQSRTSNI